MEQNPFGWRKPQQIGVGLERKLDKQWKRLEQLEQDLVDTREAENYLKRADTSLARARDFYQSADREREHAKLALETARKQKLKDDIAFGRYGRRQNPATSNRTLLIVLGVAGLFVWASIRADRQRIRS